MSRDRGQVGTGYVQQGGRESQHQGAMGSPRRRRNAGHETFKIDSRKLHRRGGVGPRSAVVTEAPTTIFARFYESRARGASVAETGGSAWG